MINDYFDFSPRQLKFLTLLTTLTLIVGGWQFIRAYADTSSDLPPLQLIVGEDEQKLTGIFVLDPNTSPIDSLELLPGIGSVLAERIDEYRQEHRFEEVIDITNVRGIGPRTYERIKPYLEIKRW
jgi:DNA uptake protein ComE-like DNA-binding protein